MSDDVSKLERVLTHEMKEFCDDELLKITAERDAWKEMAHKLAKEIVGCGEEWAQNAYEEYVRFREAQK